MSEHNPYNRKNRSWRPGVPMMLAEHPQHPELCHVAMRVIDSYLMQLTKTIPRGERRNSNKNS
jgi:hypothetical protein